MNLTYLVEFWLGIDVVFGKCRFQGRLGLLDTLLLHIPSPLSFWGWELRLIPFDQLTNKSRYRLSISHFTIGSFRLNDWIL